MSVKGFISDTSGDLVSWGNPYRTIRTDYCKVYRRIKSGRQLRSTVRSMRKHGQYAWPGGYLLFFITSDGEALSLDAVLENFRSVMNSVRNHLRDGWRVVGVESSEQCEELTLCAHTGEVLSDCPM